MKTEHEENTVCNAESCQNRQEIPGNMICFPELDEWIENPFSQEEISAAKTVDELFGLKRVDADG